MYTGLKKTSESEKILLGLFCTWVFHRRISLCGKKIPANFNGQFRGLKTKQTGADAGCFCYFHSYVPIILTL